MEIKFFIGIDVSKNELDFAVMHGRQMMFHREIENNVKSINTFLKELLKLPGFDLKQAVFCMEHTGIYNNHLLVILHKIKANIWLEAVTQIKNSLGNIRGKNDKIDAIRIAEYAHKNRDEIRFWTPKRDVLVKLSQLASTRARLIQVRKILTNAIHENDGFITKKIAKQNENLCSQTLKSINADLLKTEKAMEQLVSEDTELKRLFGLITSVCGVGNTTATQIVITTNEFKDINEAKKFACYAGVVPFTKESGIFKGKARVSHMANKKVKTLLHLAAMVAIQHSPEIKNYYERKVNEEKKNKMTVINAVRNKLILRIFACVKQNRMYEKKYSKLVA
jgi:transposase